MSTGTSKTTAMATGSTNSVASPATNGIHHSTTDNHSHVETPAIGSETPPRRSSFSELGTPISGPHPITSATDDHGWESLMLSDRVPQRRNPRSSRREWVTASSLTSSLKSVKSGYVAPTVPLEGELEGIVVQTTRLDEDGEELSLPMSTVTRDPVTLHGMLSDLKQHMDKAVVDMREQSRNSFEKILLVVQQESARRTALEQRLHSQLLLQSETMVAMEMKLLRLEAKVERREAAMRQRGSLRAPSFRTIEETEPLTHRPQSPEVESAPEPTNIAVFTSSASLASGMTAEGFLGDGEDSESKHQSTGNEDGATDEGDDDDEIGGEPLVATAEVVLTASVNDEHGNDSDSTPTQGSRPTAGSLSMLLNPIGESSLLGASTRAMRGDADGASSLATSVTNSTLTSTVVTAATRGDSVQRGASFRTAEVMPRGRPTAADAHDTRSTRSRSQSPLTVSVVVDAPSASSASIGTSMVSNTAVAPARSFVSRRAAAAAAAGSGTVDSRPLANRVVSFTTNILGQHAQEAGDSITMPDELDNLSEVADTFAASARSWREEYEARLDALQKRWSSE